MLKDSCGACTPGQTDESLGNKSGEKLEKDEEKEGKRTRGRSHCVFATNNSSQGRLSAFKMREVEGKWNHDGLRLRQISFPITFILPDPPTTFICLG